jgi:hypothetical protein
MSATRKQGLRQAIMLAMILLVISVTGSRKATVGMLFAQRLGRLFLDADNFHPAENIEFAMIRIRV